MTHDAETAKQHGKFLDERRQDLGLKWSEVARDMERLHGISVTADYLSKVKRGAAPLAKVSLDVREALRNVLRIPDAIWEQETGLYTPTATTSGSMSRPGPLVKPRLPEVEVRLEVPIGLQEAIEKYGDDYPELHLEANQRALTSLHRYGGANDLSSKEWFEVFMANRRWLVRADDRN
ncbi:hypothetical protein [Deinococcus radiotolerans]|uniref:HTH cro/C1-type domain-containing protein n=1 Tax=Deinococcus radiotolerans TaxID=1309407 RepID=A0ABQ2FEW7_9DEIO|nr:hypothetical protein [Deinococcus radiotolerans]GGK91602.1 hypothetical protein GCM10010844_07650 [Deinococcus radiotolerans]